jgi:hypothetical protein
MRRLFLLAGASPRDRAVEAWLGERPGDLGTLARRWFDVMRRCGGDVRELLHDGHPTACVGDAAFAYVDAFRTHVNVGFFHGTELDDPARLLQGGGKFMRHVSIRPGGEPDSAALEKLIEAAYAEMKAYRLAASAPPD